MIFVGLLFEKDYEKAVIENSRGGFVQNQVNNFQWNLIDGLKLNDVKDIQILNVLPVGSYPFHYKNLFLKKKLWGEKNIEIGTINIPLFKQLSRYLKIRKILKKSADKNIIIYSTYLPLKDKNIILVVADLPEYYDLGKTNVIKKTLRKINNHFVYKYIRRVDKFILLTEDMKTPLAVNDRPYQIIEGVFNSRDFCKKPNYPKDKHIILYSGTLNSLYGIKELLDSFLEFDDDCSELHIYGDGDSARYVQKCALIDKRVIFHGFQPRQVILEAYLHASLLVNPRKNDSDYVKYSFPSKTMEYLASGVPVLAYKLDGIPNEYDKYINYVDVDFNYSFKKIFDNYDLYCKKAMAAKEFIYKEKNAFVQASKIKKFLV